MFVKSVLAGLFCGALAVQPVVAADHFFPERPSGAVVKKVTGTLMVYGHGEGVGGVQVKDSANHTWTFYMGYPMRIDGKRVICFSPPDAYGSNKSDLPCPDWPLRIRLGYTVVTVSYWQASLDGKTVNVTDELNSRR
jgi:hypothetical protein